MENFIMENFLTQIENIASTYNSDNIFILGKGPSADLVQPEVCANSLVIGLNDAEHILPVDITILNHRWAEESVSKAGFKSQLYVAATDFSPPHKPVIKAPHIPLTQESSDLLMQRFMSDQFFIEDVLFLSALKIAKLVASIRKRTQTVYMIGFDFDASLGVSKKIQSTPHAVTSTDGLKISAQEFYFINALYFLKNSSIDVKHIGSRTFSSMPPAELNAAFINSPHDIPNSGKVDIIAELTTNHFGDRSRLERMIRASKAAGANYIKLQKRDVDTFYTKEQLASPYVSPFGKTFADYRYQLELSADDFNFVKDLCKQLNIGWFASILDEASFKFIQQFEPAMIKLPSTISEHKEFLSLVAHNYTGSVVLSTGMTDKNYEDFVLNNFSKCEKLFLLQCNSAYPTPLHDCNIGVVRHYHDLHKADSRIIPGYSSHDIGWEASALAVAAGAQMLEKHVKLGNTEWAHFDAVAIDLTTDAFKNFVLKIRETEMILGHEEKKINSSEHHKYFLNKEG